MGTWAELDHLNYKLCKQYVQARNSYVAADENENENDDDKVCTPKISRKQKATLKSSLVRSFKRMRHVMASRDAEPKLENDIQGVPTIESLVSNSFSPCKNDLTSAFENCNDRYTLAEPSITISRSEYHDLLLASKTAQDKTVIPTEEYRELLTSKKTLLRIMNSKLLTAKIFCPSPESKEMISHMMALTPQQSLESAELTLGMSTNYVLNELGISASPEQIASTTPSTTAIRGIISHGATSALWLFRERILNVKEKNYLYLSCDKGGGRLIKKISRWNPLTQAIESFTLDTDNSEETSKECANGVEFSMRRLQLEATDEILNKLILRGSTTDSGGGGTGHSFKAELLKRENLTCGEPEFLIGFCVMHILQLTLSTPMKTLMGEGGLEKRNFLQLCHSLYDFECKFEPSEWLVLANEARKDLGLDVITSWKKIQAPILTRWGTVGMASRVVCDKEKMATYNKISQWVVNAYPSNNASNKIASSILSLMREPLIMSDAHLSNGFMNYFFDINYSWLETGDPEVGGTLGFLSRHLLVRSFIIHDKLQSALNGGWKKFEEFKSFCEFKDLRENEQKKQEDKANAFFKLALEPVKKHFAIWSNELLFFGLFGEFETSSCLAKILGLRDSHFDARRQFGDSNGISLFKSAFHKATINLRHFEAFITSSCDDIIAVGESFHWKKLEGLAKELRGGHDIWNPTYKGTWKEVFLNQYAAHATHTQLVEAAVKDSNFCSKKNRPEEYQSQIGQIRAGILTDINKEARRAQVDEKIKRDGKGFKEDKGRVKIRGFHKVATAIKISRSQAESALRCQKYVRELMKSYVVEKFSEDRSKRKTSAVLAKKDIQREPNAVQRMRGYHQTSQMKGEVQFGKLNANLHLDLLRRECIARGMPSEEAAKVKVTMAKTFIKTDEQARNPDGNEKFFKPVGNVTFEEWFRS
jgi:hypothetical protein